MFTEFIQAFKREKRERKKKRGRTFSRRRGQV
jgi:hypothetical protein